MRNKLIHRGKLCGLVTNEFYTGNKPAKKNVFDQLGIKRM